MQGRPKGGKNKYYSKEEKIKIVQEMLNGKQQKILLMNMVLIILFQINGYTYLMSMEKKD